MKFYCLCCSKAADYCSYSWERRNQNTLNKRWKLLHSYFTITKEYGNVEYRENCWMRYWCSPKYRNKKERNTNINVDCWAVWKHVCHNSQPDPRCHLHLHHLHKGWLVLVPCQFTHLSVTRCIPVLPLIVQKGAKATDGTAPELQQWSGEWTALSREHRRARMCVCDSISLWLLLSWKLMLRSTHV